MSGRRLGEKKADQPHMEGQSWGAGCRLGRNGHSSWSAVRKEAKAANTVPGLECYIQGMALLV